MTRPNPGLPAMARPQRGFSMLEILVTLFLLTIWLLASAGVQSSSLQFNKAAQFRTQAVYLATELAERMQANKTATVAGGYVYSGAAITSPDCLTAACTSAQLSQFDLAEWNGRVTGALPNATVAVTMAGATPIVTYTIVIGWSDRRTDRTYDSSLIGTSESFSYTATKTILN